MELSSKIICDAFKYHSVRHHHYCHHPSAAGRAQDSESSPVRDRRSTTVPRNQRRWLRGTVVERATELRRNLAIASRSRTQNNNSKVPTMRASSRTPHPAATINVTGGVFHGRRNIRDTGVSITALLYNGPLLCGFNMTIKGLNTTLIIKVIGSDYRVSRAQTASSVDVRCPEKASSKVRRCAAATLNTAVVCKFCDFLSPRTKGVTHVSSVKNCPLTAVKLNIASARSDRVAAAHRCPVCFFFREKLPL